MTRVRTVEEQETIIRFDRTDDPAVLWMAAPPVTRRWVRLGYAVVREPGGWRASVVKKLVSFRRVPVVGRNRPARVENPSPGAGFSTELPPAEEG